MCGSWLEPISKGVDNTNQLLAASQSSVCVAGAGGFVRRVVEPILTGKFARCWTHSGAQVSGALIVKLIVYLCLSRTFLNTPILKNPHLCTVGPAQASSSPR